MLHFTTLTGRAQQIAAARKPNSAGNSMHEHKIASKLHAVQSSD